MAGIFENKNIEIEGKLQTWDGGGILRQILITVVNFHPEKMSSRLSCVRGNLNFSCIK